MTTEARSRSGRPLNSKENDEDISKVGDASPVEALSSKIAADTFTGPGVCNKKHALQWQTQVNIYSAHSSLQIANEKNIFYAIFWHSRDQKS